MPSRSKLTTQNTVARLNKTKLKMFNKKNKPSLSSQDHHLEEGTPDSPPHSPGNNSAGGDSTQPPTSYAYKGFHTSITSIFANPRLARVDCCAISCCGVFQSDYNRYVLFGKRPPTFKNRFVQHFFIPLFFFCAAGYAAVFIKDRNINQFVSTALLFLSIFWVIGGCMQGTQKRSITRRDLMRYAKVTEMTKKSKSWFGGRKNKKNAKNDNHQRDGDGDNDDDEHSHPNMNFEDRLDLEQTEAEMYTAHRMCGCYPSDQYHDSQHTGQRRKREPDADFCARLSRLFSSLCCGKLLRCQLQLCGSCALAQEGRQIDAIVPAERRRLDYVTFESYLSYFNDIRKLRKEQNGKLWCHYMALSKLSRILIKCLIAVIIVLDFVSLVFKPSNFNWGNMLVFMCTFLQAFLVLYFVHWEWNRFDISLDAVIKYFACGFVISTSTAIVFELLESSLLHIVAKILMIYLPLEQENGEYQSSPSASAFFGYSVMDPYTLYNQNTTPMSASSEYKKAFSHKYPLIAIAFLFVNAYFVAALVEETCKYFGFIMVEHPDFMTLKQLKKAAAYGIPNLPVVEDDRFEWGGGLDCGDGLQSHDGAHYESFDDGEDEQYHGDEDDGDDDHEEEDDHEGGGNENDNGNEREKHQPLTSTVLGGLILKKVELTEAPPRTIQSIGSAITVAMVSVALGFACCENLLYIFLYNGGNLETEISVLISRSLFPVHPLCAGKCSLSFSWTYVYTYYCSTLV